MTRFQAVETCILGHPQLTGSLLGRTLTGSITLLQPEQEYLERSGGELASLTLGKACKQGFMEDPPVPAGAVIYHPVLVYSIRLSHTRR